MQIIINNELAGTIEQEANHWIAMTAGEEIICKTEAEARETIHEIYEWENAQ